MGKSKKQKAEALLSQFKKKGSFLVRLSTTEPHLTPFTISRYTAEKKVEHQRVFRTKAGLYTHVKTSKSTQKVEVAGGIDVLIKKVAKGLDLKVPCPGSVYQAIFAITEGGDNGYVEPSDSDSL